MRSLQRAVAEALAPQPWVPDADQRRGVKFLLEHQHAGLLADPGVGKTSITLQAAKLLLHEGLIERVVVVAPKRPCYLVWPAEGQKWEQFNALRFANLHGADREDQLRSKADVYVISNHHDNLQWLFSGGRWRRLAEGAMFVIDESSKFKYMRTQRFNAIRPFLKNFSRRVILTGSPAPNGLLDLHGQVYLLDMGKTFTPFTSYYQRAFFDVKGYGGFGAEPKPGAEKEIFKRLAPYVLRLEDKGTGRPKMLTNPVQVVLPPKARKAYDELEDQMFTLIDAKELTAFNAGALITKLGQIASGGIYEEREVDPLTGAPIRAGKRKWIKLHDEKTEALLDLIDELQGQPLLIAYHWGHDLERLKKALGKKLAVMGGGSIKQDQVLQDAWNRGELPQMAGHPASIGHGLNLQTGGAHHIFDYTLTYDYELYDQYGRRLARRGNPAKYVRRHQCVAKDTVDEDKVLALDRKARGQDALFAAMLAYRRRGRR